MRTALDTSVLLDLITADPRFSQASEAALRAAAAEGALILGECVLAEITPALAPPDLAAFLSDLQITYVPSSRQSATLAGEMFGKYLTRRGGAARRVLPDFLIGAHARLHADRILARDRGYYRDYFKGLKLLEP